MTCPPPTLLMPELSFEKTPPWMFMMVFAAACTPTDPVARAKIPAWVERFRVSPLARLTAGVLAVSCRMLCVTFKMLAIEKLLPIDGRRTAYALTPRRANLALICR